jgi:hypothetical protein
VTCSSLWKAGRGPSTVTGSRLVSTSLPAHCRLSKLHRTLSDYRMTAEGYERKDFQEADRYLSNPKRTGRPISVLRTVTTSQPNGA